MKLQNMYKDVKHFNIVVWIFVSLFFFPSITFGTLKAEVFPWAIMFSSIILLKQKRINIYYVIFLVTIILNIVIFSIATFPELKIPEVIRSSLAYINSSICLVIFYQASENNTLKTIKLLKVIFLFLIVLGILQFSGLISFLDPLFKLLIPRASSESLSFVRRGVTLLSTEPARAGVSLIFIYVVVKSVFIKKGRIISDVLFFIFLVIILKSIMALMLYFVYILLVYRVKFLRIIAVLLLLMIFLDTFGGGERSKQMINKIKTQESFSDAVMVVVDLAGPRLISIYSSWLYAVHNPLGGGIGHWEKSSVEALKMTGADFSKINYFKFKGDSKPIPIRSSGYVSNLVLDTGFLGVGVFFIFIYAIFSKFWKNGMESKNIILIFLFKIMFIGSVGPPGAWISTILALKYLDYEKKHKINDG